MVQCADHKAISLQASHQDDTGFIARSEVPTLQQRRPHGLSEVVRPVACSLGSIAWHPTVPR